MYRNILVAVDGSDTSNRALEHAIALARSENARILAIYVVEYPSTVYSSGYIDVEPFHDAMLQDARAVLDRVQLKMRDAGLMGEARMVDAGVLSGSIAIELHRTASDAGSDLVVMGTHGRRGFQRLMMGSVAESYVRLSNCPVMLVPYRNEDGSAPDR